MNLPIARSFHFDNTEKLREKYRYKFSGLLNWEPRNTLNTPTIQWIRGMAKRGLSELSILFVNAIGLHLRFWIVGKGIKYVLRVLVWPSW